ncbi:hypothetical protein KC332_g16916 [Hortaea werneckii]|uniref:Uncharacterized protein n=2 Tax=Hortaea werneckii TaxID=91943 RepID=A0A3M7I0N0_HORWE|nr:hypothetical protein KC358_g17052 [Hortaea werneckii]OTA34428.1 hypothetical protein BTJ68_04816 [Hortaea werneckii EXF-2000]KAI6796102.1 hypothetical protein KC350_g16894 [Hortaea werneckii]KAI6899832.1 hypothetical protein KC348_g17023 [Hortaea werneckii]KAI6919893.1 hypothetical protein KC341_g16981 [Hortaea werneckii]
MSARFFLGLGAIAALPITWGLFITADHADLPFGTPGSNAVQSRFQHFQTHAFDTSRSPQRVPRSARYNSGEKGSLHSQLDHSPSSSHGDDAEQHPSPQTAGGKWSHVRDGLRREAPRGNLGGAADPGMSLADVMAEREKQS